MIRILTAVLSVMLCLALSLGQTVSRVGTTSAPFLKIGVGARALAMGEAYVTQAEDITALYWNPAGLGRLSKTNAVFTHYDYVADLGYELKGPREQVCTQCHEEKETKGFMVIHNKHVNDKNIDCSTCHNFTRPERGLSTAIVFKK